jgi:hypothetical protein
MTEISTFLHLSVHGVLEITPGRGSPEGAFRAYGEGVCLGGQPLRGEEISGGCIGPDFVFWTLSVRQTGIINKVIEEVTDMQRFIEPRPNPGSVLWSLPS